MSPPNPGRIVVDVSRTSAISFVAHDGNDPRFVIRGRIDSQSDNLTFCIVTRILSTGDKSAINPEAFFDAMMNHFAGQPGGHPDAIRAIWDDTDPELVTNLVRFNTALANGDDPITAARKTFTGRMATKYGYTVVSFGFMDPQTDSGPYKTATVVSRK